VAAYLSAPGIRAPDDVGMDAVGWYPVCQTALNCKQHAIVGTMSIVLLDYGPNTASNTGGALPLTFSILNFITLMPTPLATVCSWPLSIKPKCFSCSNMRRA
jgi:hypothetical protein